MSSIFTTAEETLKWSRIFEATPCQIGSAVMSSSRGYKYFVPISVAHHPSPLSLVFQETPNSDPQRFCIEIHPMKNQRAQGRAPQLTPLPQSRVCAVKNQSQDNKLPTLITATPLCSLARRSSSFSFS